MIEKACPKVTVAPSQFLVKPEDWDLFVRVKCKLAGAGQGLRRQKAILIGSQCQRGRRVRGHTLHLKYYVALNRS